MSFLQSFLSVISCLGSSFLLPSSNGLTSLSLSSNHLSSHPSCTYLECAPSTPPSSAPLHLKYANICSALLLCAITLHHSLHLSFFYYFPHTSQSSHAHARFSWPLLFLSLFPLLCFSFLLSSIAPSNVCHVTPPRWRPQDSSSSDGAL